jgi:hypothetical protein
MRTTLDFFLIMAKILNKRKWDIIIPALAILGTVALGATIKIPMSLQSFNAGELSPLLNARSNFPKYHSGAKTLENMLVRSQGPVERRPGTKYIAEVKDATDTIRIIPFEYSTSDAYIIELGDEYARFYRAGAQIQDGGSAYEVVTPWDSNDVFELQFVQDAEFMRLAHPDYQPYKLTRTTASHTSFTCTAIDFSGGPFFPDNDDDTQTITASAKTGTVTLTTTSALFDSDHVGALWRIRHLVDANTVSGYVSGGASSATLEVFKGQSFDMVTGDWWGATIKIERSYDEGSTWDDATQVWTVDSHADGNLQYAGKESYANALYRVTVPTLTWGSCYVTLSTRSGVFGGAVEITVVSDANTATAIVEDNNKLADVTATYRWAEGMWSDYRGWPRTVEHYEQRCVYGGSDTFPQTIWASVTADEDSEYDNFDAADANDDDAYMFILPGMNPIQWMRAQEYLMIGTTGGVGRFGMTNAATTPANLDYRMQSHTGSDYIQAVRAVDSILFVERGGQKVREVGYTFASDSYVATDMTILAEHITGTGITSIAFQYRPDPILWCVRDDGQLLSFTYNKRHEVQAWARQTTDGTFDSVAQIPGTDEDVVYTVASRTIDSNDVSYIENFAPLNWTDQNDAWFVDSGTTDGNDVGHLEGEEVVILADARPIGPNTVSSGAVAATGYTNYVMGLPYTSIYESMPLVAQGEAALLKTAVLHINYDFQDTLACNHGTDADNVTAIQFSEDDFATTIDAFTGVKTTTFPRGQSRDRTIYIDVNDPVPMTLRGINPQLEVMTD